MNNDQLAELVKNNEFYLSFKTPRDERILEAMRKVDRLDFLFDYLKEKGLNMYIAYEDKPVPIGFGQTCSQPSIVAFMADVLELEEGHKVLEIGSGCGYSAAVTLYLIGYTGYLVTIERIPQLVGLTRRNLKDHFNKTGAKSQYKSVYGDGSEGFKTIAPYDRIYLTAAMPLGFDISKLVQQLNPNDGIILFPEQSGGLIDQKYEKLYGSLIRQRYKRGNLISLYKYKGVNFVPLIIKNS